MTSDGFKREGRRGDGDTHLQDQQNQEEPAKTRHHHLKQRTLTVTQITAPPIGQTDI